MGIATVQICSMTQVANMVGSPRVLASRSVLYPTGDPSLDAEGEKELRRQTILKALQALAGRSDHAA